MKKIGWILLIIGIAIIGFYTIYIKSLENKANENIEDYIKETSIIEEQEEQEIIEPIVEEKVKKKNTINYTAILEIPVISLKSGIVNSTKNFYSINYAISADRSSNYPNEYGNFILYAHSGNSSIAYFKHLSNVNIDDSVYVYFNGIKYHYVIFDKYDIEKTGKAVFKRPINDNYITLITCNQNRKGYQIVLTGKLINTESY